ncbi:hypothetical protein BN946_scf184994.g16 [Trametes cinnabarina]|uniref:Peptidase S53 domain-containing protein n=1 Tax=Pycnoporus cinnabarinus TaxID=5643 RepID=A0A060SK07_PYCCI|nr:hypothetical protein BN946_scf184994.g16 [Trametes cinnabarina]
MLQIGLVGAALLFILAQGKSATRSTYILEARASSPAGFMHSGPASPDTILNLRLALVPGDIPGLERALYDVSSPSSPQYGQHLSKEEVEHFVAPKPESLAAVYLWLAEHGIDAKTLTPAGDWIGFSIAVEKASELLNTNFSVFTHQDTGITSIRTLSYAIPADLRDHIQLVHPTVSFSNPRSPGPAFHAVQPVAPSRVKRSAAADSATVPAACASPTPIRPKCLQELYSIPTALAKSTSNHIGVIGYNDNSANLADLQSFLTNFRPDLNPSTTFILESVDGGTNPQDPSDSTGETYTVGLASGVPVHFIQVGEESGHNMWLDTVTYLLGQSAPPHVVTSSYAEPEDNGSQAFATNPALRPTYRSQAHLHDIASVTSVGATTGFAPETGASLTSGGFSNYFARPQYQNTSVPAYLSKLGSEYAGKFSPTGRAFPDVSAQGVEIEYIWQGAEWLFTGTSASSPIFASIIALLNDELITAGKPPLGFLNPWLYTTAASAFTDITSGNNPGCGTNGFPAEAGWDPVSGLGTPNYTKLRTAAGL